MTTDVEKKSRVNTENLYKLFISFMIKIELIVAKIQLFMIYKLKLVINKSCKLTKLTRSFRRRTRLARHSVWEQSSDRDLGGDGGFYSLHHRRGNHPNNSCLRATEQK